MRHARSVLLVLLAWLGLVVILSGSQARPVHAASGQSGYPSGSQGTIVASGYIPDQQETQPWRGPLTTADTSTLTNANLNNFTVANGGRIKCLGKPNAPLSIRFTSGPGTTCAVAFVAIWVNPATPTVNHVLGISDITTITVPAWARTDPDGRYMVPTLLSDSYGGSDGIWLLVSAPSAGSVYFDPGTY